MANDPSFVHLRLHSEYSVVDGMVRIDDAIDRAVATGMPALALTDLDNLFAMVKFYKEARSRGIKPLIGADVWISNDDNRDQPSRLLLLCQSRRGYYNLCVLLSRAYRENQYRGRAELRRDWLTADDAADLIALSGAQWGDVGQALVADKPEQAESLLADWAARFPGRFYVEVQRAGHAHQEMYIRQAVTLAGRLRLPVVATHPIQFLDPDDFRAHEARVCIAEGYVLNDPRRPKPYTMQQYFKSPDEMAALFHDLPAALVNAVEIAKRCNFDIVLGKNFLPDFPTPEGMTLDDYLVHRAKDGLNERLEVLYPDPAEREKVRPMYEERLEFEYKTIIQMKFPGYFLIVSDFIQWAKENGVPVGPGRGSGAGSLVAYSLKITDLDPTRYDLLFERFLNPERVSMPDFDVDFCMDNRERVIDYVKHKYGIESVSQIATFGTMAAKAVIRDVGRVLDLGYGFVDSLAKLIPNELGMTLAKAREMEPQINERAKNEEEVAELLALAEKLEGMTRNVGMHAGGVLIAPGKITDFAPVYIASGSDSVVSQFDKDDVEQVGLVKFDFLGLRTLTIIDWALKSIQTLKGELPFDLDNLPLDDKPTYDLLKGCDTTAVFQLESRGMKDLIKRLQPDCFEDIIALVALFRPGPLGSGMVDDFINRKHGRQKADYFHPKLEETLKSTYGIILYQEQVMLIAQILAGYSLGGADMLRRAMGKKKAEEMAKHREIFTTGATERGVDPALAGNLFDLMEKFAEYGFNKSHSAAYALVAYQTAYLKAHYPAAFMAATLSADMDDTDKVRIFYEDARDSGIRFLPPDVNASSFHFVPVADDAIRYGLGGVKGVGESAIESILLARGQGPFRDLFDFCKRVDRRAVNKRAVEALVRAGAFDSINPDRASLFASIGLAMETAEQAARSANQSSLFGEDDAMIPPPELVSGVAWSDKDRLQFEKQSLGFFFSGHPFDSWRRDISPLVKKRLAELTPQPQPQLLAGIILGVRTVMTRRGKMAIVLLDDATVQMEVVVFNDLFEPSRAILREDDLLVVEGRVQEDKFSGGLRINAEKLFDLTGARRAFGRTLRLRLDRDAGANRLIQLLAPHRQGPCQVHLEYANPQARCEVVLGDEWKVDPAAELLEELAGWLGPDNVEMTYEYVPPQRQWRGGRDRTPMAAGQ